MHLTLFSATTLLCTLAAVDVSSAEKIRRTSQHRSVPNVASRAVAAEQALFSQRVGMIDNIKAAMQASIRTSWEQGTAAGGVLEYDEPKYSVFADNPFQNNGHVPVAPLQFALSAVVRQAADGRLSQVIGDGLDAASLDGASAGPAVLLGSFADKPARQSYWKTAAEKQLNYILTQVPHTDNGAFSQRADSKQFWADGVYMGPPFLAYYGAVTNNSTLLQLAYDNIRLYREVLLIPNATSTGPLWAHLYDDDKKAWQDKGIWGTGNGWAGLGIIHVAATIEKSKFKDDFKNQTADLAAWAKEIIDGTFANVNKTSGLIPDYIDGSGSSQPGFGDASASAAIVTVAYRAAKMWPEGSGSPVTFGSNYTDAAAKIRDAVFSNVNDLGVLSPYVDPLSWSAIGLLSTEGQSFGLMMFAAWRDWLGLNI
ncbi:hypothetical protein PLICRDRAFT_106862 [Plicaturopsis crispa FD-325 SS-3]|nr:hypothetical protein PLICRDRAFT_106862 [Plicaturopsis crispa FD-325 SS-3]